MLFKWVHVLRFLRDQVPEDGGAWALGVLVGLWHLYFDLAIFFALYVW
jgi:hypothetical protein